MSAIDPRTPVLVGVGQGVVHWTGDDPAVAPDPSGLRALAAKRALADSGAAEALAGLIDEVVAVRTMADSVPGADQPFGRCANPPGTLAADLGLSPSRLAYSVVGGDQPQALVNAAAAAIHAGEARAVLIAGSEATAALKTAARRGIALDWSRSVEGDFVDRGLGAALLSRYELTNGLGAPVHTYPAFEHALRARLGSSRAAHADAMAALWAGFSRIAAANPHSQFPLERSVDFLRTPGPENYPIADPYLKWHVAQDAVNQGAAVILTSEAKADRIGIARDRRVYLHGHAQAANRTPTERADLSRSIATELVLDRALAASGRAAADIALFDLYSCFPCAVFTAVEAMGLDWRGRDWTVTGGLPFFGGPGNSYSLHAIATMAERLRAAPGAFGLVLANGGYLSKEAAGVYSAQPPADWQPVDSSDLARAIAADPAPSLVEGACEAVIESYSVGYAKGTPARGYAIGRTDSGARVLARVRREDGAMLRALLGTDPVGRRMTTGQDGAVNVITELAG